MLLKLLGLYRGGEVDPFFPLRPLGFPAVSYPYLDSYISGASEQRILRQAAGKRRHSSDRGPKDIILS